MSESSRRFEILLPLRFNNGQAVPDTLLVDVVQELERHFGSVSSETQIIRGVWQHEGVSIRDELVRVFVDVPDLQEHREFFLAFKERLKQLFGQLEIWITSYPVDIL